MAIWTAGETKGAGAAAEAVSAAWQRLNRTAVALDRMLSGWLAQRRLQALDDTMLKDIGVARGGIEWAVREGRDERRTARTQTPG